MKDLKSEVAWFHLAAMLISLKLTFCIRSIRNVNKVICKLRIIGVISTYIVVSEEKML